MGIDLLDPQDIVKLWAYLRRCKPACGVIATPCTGLGGFSGINRILHLDSWLDSREVSVPLGELGARVAEYQLSKGLHFIAENPQISELWELPTWKRILAKNDVVSCVVHQCMAGLRDPENKLRVKKPTTFVASYEILVKDLRPLWCTGNHQHS